MRLCFVDHRLQLRRCHVLTEFARNLLKVLKRDVILLLGEQDESFLQLLVTVTLWHLCSHNVNEVIFVNGYHAFLVFVLVPALSVICQFWDESLDLLLGWLKAECAQGYSQILKRDVAIRVSVEQLEGLLKVLPLLLRQLLSVLATCLLAGGGGGSVDRLGRQGHHLSLVEFVSRIRLSDKTSWVRSCMD